MAGRFDYRVLTVDVQDEAWADRTAQEYARGDFDGVYLRLGGNVRLRGVGDLARLPHLRYIEVNGSVVDDTAAFGLPSVEELVLLTRCEVEVPAAIGASRLRRLCVDDRPGVHNLRGAAGLRSLTLWGWYGHDLGFLDGVSGLAHLHIEGRGQTASLRGIEGCSSLRQIELVGMGLDDLRPLAGLSRLRSLWVAGPTSRPPDEVVLDLADLAHLDLLEELKLVGVGAVRSVRPLVEMASLEEVRLRDTPILDGDETPLVAAREWMRTVLLPNDWAPPDRCG